MVNYEPGQDRNIAALNTLVMCDGFIFYETPKRILYEESDFRS